MKKSTMKQSTLCNIMAGITVLFAVAIFVAGVITSQLFNKVTILNRAQTQIYSNLKALVTSVNYTKDMARSYSHSGNVLYLDMYNKSLESQNSTSATLEKLKLLTDDPRGTEQLTTVITQIDSLINLEKQAIELTSSNKLKEAQNIVFGKDYGMTLDGMNLAIDEFEKGMNRGIGTIILQQSNNVMYLGFLIMSLCVFLIVVQITNTMATKKMIIAPIIKLKNSMIKMNDGQLSGDVDVTVDSTEIGELANAMYSMRSKINEYIKEISFILHCISQKNMVVDIKNEYVGDFTSIQSSLSMIIESLNQTFESLSNSTDGISSSAEQVSNAGQILAQGASTQASSVEELSAAINEISEKLKDTAINADTAKSLAFISEENMNVSNQQMAHMVQAISEISDTSSQIGKIIKTIEDIAFQTNILALNAAVEAARAGTAGKGFAVVADEVRNLATKSSDAAKQTNILIQNSVQSVQSGVRIADETAQTLTEVVTNSQTMAELVNKISHASSEQALAISQINLGVEQISSVVQTNLATSEQSAATSEDLSSQTQMMKRLVSSFKIKSNI